MFDETMSNAILFNRKHQTRGPQSCPLDNPENGEVDYKNIQLLKQYISEKGRVLPSRVSYVSSKNQRRLKQAIRRARKLALLPFTVL
uniref:30S ribosomal protein S18 n=1 Tax=Rickettsiales endosymbiont of Peranema trichophorum TaxID=2486577 RepID=UPI00397B3D4E